MAALVSSSDSFDITSIAQKYIEWDPNPFTRTIVEELLKAGAMDQLDSLLRHRIQFGTAGLRAAMGPGYKNMNDLVIIQTCQGLARYLEAHFQDAHSKVSPRTFSSPALSHADKGYGLIDTRNGLINDEIRECITREL